jgi:quercetin dioxygenase-like cupin family protein
MCVWARQPMLRVDEELFGGVALLDRTPLRITEPEAGLTRQVLSHSATMMLVRHEMREGWRGAAHKHPHEQLVYVISGHLHIAVGGVTFDVVTGDNFIVPSNVEHQAIALQDSVVLDVFTPVREDYL